MRLQGPRIFCGPINLAVSGSQSGPCVLCNDTFVALCRRFRAKDGEFILRLLLVMLVIMCRAVICPVFICVVGTRVIAKTDKIDG
jgi:hypothetical protein